jgi:hypothetical protein
MMPTADVVAINSFQTMTIASCYVVFIFSTGQLY